MGKDFKVIRNKRRSGRRSLGKAVGVVLAAALLFAAGWLLYQPVYDWVMDLNRPGAASTPEDPQSQSSSEEIPAEPQEAPAQQTEAPLEAVWIPAQVTANTTALQSYLTNLPGDPVNAVVLELKNESGRVLYRSGLPEVAAARAQADNAYDLRSTVDALHQAGYTVLGRLYAFQDSTATSALDEGKVRYAGTEYAWLDNSAAAGGKPWLNPYAAQAQDYIAALAAEALELGVDGLVLDGLQFPTGLSLELADYGDTGELTRPKVLNRFAGRIAGMVEQAGGRGCWIYFEAEELLLPEEAGEYGPYGGDAAAAAGDLPVMVNVMPALFGTGEEPALDLPEAPITQPGATVEAALRALPLRGDRSQVMPVLQAYTADGIALEFNLTYGQEEIAQQLEAARAYGARDAALYHPQGSYDALR